MSSPYRSNGRRRASQSNARRPSVDADTPNAKTKPRRKSGIESADEKADGPARRTPERQQRRRKGHKATDSTGDLLPRSNGRTQTSSSPRTSRQSEDPSSSSGNPLKAGNLAQLNAINTKRDRKSGFNTYDQAYLQEVRAKELALEEKRVKGARKSDQKRKQEEANTRTPERRRDRKVSKPGKRPDPEMVEVLQTADIRTRRQSKYERLEDEKRRGLSVTPKRKQRVVSGPFVEDGRAEEVYRRKKSRRKATGGTGGKPFLARFQNRKVCCICLGAGVVVILIVIIAAIAIAVSKKKKGGSSHSSSSSSRGDGKPNNSNLDGLDPKSIPASVKGGYLDPFSWYDTEDFNVTYTSATVGGLYVMGLDSTWDDSAQANSNVPPLNKPFSYGSTPIRGINVGGWLSLEPFITPSFFTAAGVVDEWTLTRSLGTSAASKIEPHYSSFITKNDFAAIRAAGFDHVRIPFSYWAVTTYSGDPYVSQISWRYLLRGIEYCRQNGLRVNLDLHGAPGSQNGWNHSGKQGAIGWLNGTDGDLNAQRTIDIHNQLSTFFAQDRYKNVVTIYGLLNEPKMVALDVSKVVNWTGAAISAIRGNNFNSLIVFGDGFLGLDKWQGQLQSYDNLLLDVHQYVIFNDGQISLNHSAKLTFACGGWRSQMIRSQNKATGFGPTICGEWSQADTDCAKYLNDVGVGSRWEGTLNEPDPGQSVLQPQCPSSTTGSGGKCECGDANADPSKYSTMYKQWLMAFAIAQMESFEAGWGWFYWTWSTESATQWSWKLGMEAGILPKNVADRSAFSCNQTVPDYAGLGLPEYY